MLFSLHYIVYGSTGQDAVSVYVCGQFLDGSELLLIESSSTREATYTAKLVKKLTQNGWKYTDVHASKRRNKRTHNNKDKHKEIKHV